VKFWWPCDIIHWWSDNTQSTQRSETFRIQVQCTANNSTQNRQAFLKAKYCPRCMRANFTLQEHNRHQRHQANAFIARFLFACWVTHPLRNSYDLHLRPWYSIGFYRELQSRPIHVNVQFHQAKRNDSPVKRHKLSDDAEHNTAVATAGSN